MAADCDAACVDKAVLAIGANGVFTIDQLAIETDEAAKFLPGTRRYRVQFRRVGSVDALKDITITQGLGLDGARASAEAFADSVFDQLRSERPKSDLKADAAGQKRLTNLALSAFLCAWQEWAADADKERVALARERRAMGGAVSNEELAYYVGVSQWARRERNRASVFMSRAGAKAEGCSAKAIASAARCLQLAIVVGEGGFSREVPDSCLENDGLSALVAQYQGAIDDASTEAANKGLPVFNTQPDPSFRPDE